MAEHHLTHRQTETLETMLRYCRPSGSATEQKFRDRFLLPLPDAHTDPYGNIIVRVGLRPSVLWSSHTDTVHAASGYQHVVVDHRRQRISLSSHGRATSSCLGADDTVGVFLMREMIKRAVPGLYIFHWAEEIGSHGARDLAIYSPETLDDIDFAIALDRRGTGDIVDHQHGRRCCSLEFVDSLATELARHGLRGYSATDGTHTDTAEYTGIVPECTNLSIGYYHAHTTREYINLHHVARLLYALTHLDQGRLTCARVLDDGSEVLGVDDEFDDFDAAMWAKLLAL